MAAIVGDEASERPAPKAPTSRRRNVFRQGLRLLLFALAGLEVVYLIAANVFLNTDLGPRTVNRKPEKWRLAWDGGWSIIPGHMHLDNMVFDQHGRRQDVHAEARKISFGIGLLPLAGRRFAADDVTIEGLAIAINRQTEEAEDSATIEPPAAEPPRPPKKPGWRIELTGITVDRIESFRLDGFEASGGQSRFTGDFESQVRGDMALRQAVLRWSDAALSKYDAVIAEPLEIRFDGGFSPFDPRQEKGFAVLDHIGGRVGVEGTVSRLSILQRFFAGAKWIETLNGYGRLTADLVLDEGALQPGSELIADADGLCLDFLGYATEGSGRIHGTVRDDTGEEGAGGPVRMEVAFDDFTVRRKPSNDPYMQGDDFRLVATTSDPDLRYGLSDLDVVIDMPHAEVPDLSVYGAYLPSDVGLAIESGSGVAKLHLEASAVEETAFGLLEVDAEKVGGHFQELEFEAGLEVRTRISGGDLDNFRLEIEGTRLQITDGVFRDDRNTREEGWWMTVEIPSGTAHLGDGTPWLEADVELAMRDTRVIIAMFAELKSWLQRFEKILTVKDVTGSGSIIMQGQHLYLRNLEIEGRKLRGRAELELGKEAQRGILYVRFHGLTVGLERVGKEKDWKLTGVEKWFDRRVAESW